MTSLTNLFEKQRNQQQKQQLTVKEVTSFFMIKGDRNLNGGGKFAILRMHIKCKEMRKIKKLLIKKKKEK